MVLDSYMSYRCKLATSNTVRGITEAAGNAVTDDDHVLQRRCALPNRNHHLAEFVVGVGMWLPRSPCQCRLRR